MTFKEVQQRNIGRKAKSVKRPYLSLIKLCFIIFNKWDHFIKIQSMAAITSTLHIKCRKNYKFAFIVLVSKSTVFFCLSFEYKFVDTPSSFRFKGRGTHYRKWAEGSFNTALFSVFITTFPGGSTVNLYRCKTRWSCCSYDLSVLNQSRQGEADGMDTGLSDGQGFSLPSNYPLWLIWFLTEQFPIDFCWC